MPCSDGGVPYPPTARELKEMEFAKRAPGLLCSAARVLERLGYDFDENPELADWWAAHKKEDDARIAREAAARARHEEELARVSQLLSKPVGSLTAGEIKLLRAHGKI